MDNYEIADQFSLLSKLMDIHGENSFKAKSYSSAAFTIEKLSEPLTEMKEDKIFAQRGIGESVGKKVLEIIQTGQMLALQTLVTKTPPDVLEMMNIKGLGAKKINTIWKEMQIDTIEGLREACRDDRIANKKGFGEKTQQKILESIEFQQSNQGKYLYAKIEPFAEAFDLKLKAKFPKSKFEITGDYARQLEIIETLAWVTTVDANALKKYLASDTISLITDRDGLIVFSAEQSLTLTFFIATDEDFNWKVAQTSSSEEFFGAWEKKFGVSESSSVSQRSKALKSLDKWPAFVRETAACMNKGIDKETPVVQLADIKGLIHSHSTWSDGVYPVKTMAEELIKTGFEYLVISDHSKSAYYANGLTEERIAQQHKEIDQLNKSLKPFRIFKSIECDILSNGELDYGDETLSSFDLVITSIHSNLTMDESKAMKRLLGAIENPYTSILGHMTGRLLLKRNGYPVDHKAVIDACSENDVVIEINANPNRLDMDWRWIEYALEKNVLLSINPDAHSTEEFANLKYGVLTAQKGSLRAAQNLSSYSLEEFESFLTEQHKKRPN